MNGWKRVWMAVLAMTALTFTSQSAFAQQAADPARPDFLGRVACGDGRQCDAYRLGRHTKISYLWYLAQIAVERTLGRQILTDRQWRFFRLSDMQRPLEPRVRRGETLPALINASGASELVSLELLVQLNNGTNSSGQNPFNTPAMCRGRREHPLRFGLSPLNLRVRVREEVTLMNVERLLPRGCETRGISTVDGAHALIPTSGGSTIGQRIDQLTSAGTALVANGQITFARLRADRQQMREWSARRGVMIETERRQAFDAYVDRVLEVMEQRGTTATAPVSVPVAIAPVAPQTVERIVYRDAPRIVAQQTDTSWTWHYLVAYLGVFFAVLAFVRERRRNKRLETDAVQNNVTARLQAMKDVLKREHANELDKLIRDFDETMREVEKKHDAALGVVAKDRDRFSRNADDLAKQVIEIKKSIGSLIGEVFLQLKKLYNEEIVEGRALHEPVSTLSMVFSQLKMPEPVLVLTGPHVTVEEDDDLGRRPSRPSNGNGNGRRRRNTKPGIHSLPPPAQKPQEEVTSVSVRIRDPDSTE